MVTITKEPKPRLEPIILSPEHQIEVQDYDQSLQVDKVHKNGQDMSSIFQDETFDRWYCDSSIQ